ncbi:PREDICTED: hemicentin-1-like [Branchiostoma belcheri]|uniref:Hemicentin-1-like n=1 Tax=Branchiostoma belcheri TaxID=7741 RepID=A0A6P4ZSV3_BRABE|nr:PREDICTED: hemicentin-1-like [Branchiostoma belcheri]
MDSKMNTVVEVLICLAVIRGCLGQSSIGLTLPDTVNTIAGDPVTLPATFQTDRRIATITWTKVEKKADGEKRTPILTTIPMMGSTEAHGPYQGRVELVGKASLKIDRTTAEDQGRYVLTLIGQGIGTEEGFIDLNVMGCLCQSSIGLTLPDTVNTIAGDPVTLPATFQTDRRIATITWTKVEKKADRETRTPILTAIPMMGSTEAHGPYQGRVELVGKASLKIDRTTAEDQGQYVLTLIGQGIGTEEGFIDLNVMVPPKIAVGPSDPVMAASGRSATLTCSVTEAKPNITSLHWEKDGALIDSSRLVTKYSGGNLQSTNLVIHFVTRGDAGVYKCITDHVVRKASAALTVRVLYPATILSISDAQTVSVSDRITLQCVAEGNPPPNITWTRNGVRLRGVTKTVSRDVRAESVVLDDVTVNASGIYACTAANSVGKSDLKSVEVIVQGSQSWLDDSSIAILVGAIAGGLWLAICVGLVVYFVRRRRNRQDKKRFAFYYNMGRKQPDGTDGKTGEETLEVTRHPHLKLPAKPVSGAPTYGGIDTMRRTKGKVRRYGLVLYTYHPQEDNELYLEIDDVIEVLEGEDGGWCLGYLRGRIGLFPSNYVKFLSASQVSASKLRELYDSSDPNRRSGKSSV